MAANELIIFKKETDAPGSNRGFVYQYLKTLFLWLMNYRDNLDITIFCEVDDDIKEMNLKDRTVKFTQLKCYSTALSINSDEIKKALYNYFILYLLDEDYTGKYVFETNAHLSRNDKIIKSWMNHQGALNANEEVHLACVSKTQAILREVFVAERESLERGIEKKISRRKKKLHDAATIGQDIREEIEQLDSEYEELENLALKFEEKIEDVEVVKEFTNQISWTFEDIDPVESLNIIKEQIYGILREISGDDTRIDLYFGRLLTEINFKCVQDKRDLRFLDNALLESIFLATDEDIRSGISAEIVRNFAELGTKIDGGFIEVKDTIHKSEERIIHALAETRSETNALYDMPPVSPEDVQDFIREEEEGHQSNLEWKVNNITGIDDESKSYLLETATELRCRYLLYLQGLIFRNSHDEHTEIKKLEKKIQRICTNAVIGLQVKRHISPSQFYSDLELELQLALKEFNERVKIRKFVVDEEIIYGQMFHMAAKCFLRWHREG